MVIDEQGLFWISDGRVLALVLIAAVAALVWCYRLSNEVDDARPTRLSGGHRVRPGTLGYVAQDGPTRPSEVTMIGASARRLPKRPAA